MKSAKISCELIDHMGNDLSVVNAARVSFSKESAFIQVDEGWENEELRTRLSDDDKKLVSYLAKHDHWSPFAHTFMSFRVKVPIFLARQLGKHQVGLAWNEVSRRYVSDEPEFYMPNGWRGKPAGSIKQGSSSDMVPIEGAWVPVVLNRAQRGDGEKMADFAGSALINHSKLCDAAVRLYQHMLDEGVAPEMARMVLPQSMMTEFIWSGSLMAFARICKLRLDSHAQLENLQVAQPIAAAAEQHFPESWKALLSDG